MPVCRMIVAVRLELRLPGHTVEETTDPPPPPAHVRGVALLLVSDVT